MANSAEKQIFADPKLRRTGILPIGSLPWGSHVCIFYESSEDLLEAHGDYFGDGLADNERCVWAVSEPLDRDRAIAGLREAIAGLDDYLAAGAIELIPGDQCYLRDDEVDSQRVTDAWLAKLDEALAQGFDGLRVSGNSFWTGSDLWESSLEYEEELHRSVSGAHDSLIHLSAARLARRRPARCRPDPPYRGHAPRWDMAVSRIAPACRRKARDRPAQQRHRHPVAPVPGPRTADPASAPPWARS